MSSSVKIEECRDSSSLSESDSDVLVDAVLGTGVKGKLRQPILRAVQIINSSRGFKVAVDVPTGIDSDTGEVLGEAVHANLTVTFHSMKSGLSNAPSFCGELNVADIGIPPEAAIFAGPGDVEAVRIRRPADAHKGQFGRLLVIGGSETFSGAPSLVALAGIPHWNRSRLRCSPRENSPSNIRFSPNLICIKLPGECLSVAHIRMLREHIEKATSGSNGLWLGAEH